MVIPSQNAASASPESSAASEFIGLNASSSPLATPQVDEDPFLKSLEKKQVLFQQLWKGIAQLQHESGDLTC